MNRLILSGFVVLGIGMTAFAQSDLKHHPGYVDLDEIEIPDSVGEITEVNLGPDLMRIAGPFPFGAPNAPDMPFPLSIQVKSFQTDARTAEKIKPLMEKIAKQLRDKNWKDLVRVKKNNEFVVVSVKTDGRNNQQGMVVMSVEPSGEVSFVNLVGNMDFNMLSSMGINVNGFSAMDSLKDIKERQKEEMQEARERLKKSIEKSEERMEKSKAEIEEAKRRLKELEEEGRDD